MYVFKFKFHWTCSSGSQWQSVSIAWWRHQMETFPRYWPFVRRIHRSPVNSPHKGQWRGTLLFSLICALNKRLSKQSRYLWFGTPSRPLWRHCSGFRKWRGAELVTEDTYKIPNRPRFYLCACPICVIQWFEFLVPVNWYRRHHLVILKMIAYFRPNWLGTKYPEVIHSQHEIRQPCIISNVMKAPSWQAISELMMA